MSRSRINEIQYVALVHKKMREHELYKEGMGVVFCPESSDRPSGLTEKGGLNAKSVLAWAEKKIQEEYELVIKP